MFSVVLADNTPLELISDSRDFPWEESGFFVLKKTTDWKELVQICLREKPDAVFLSLKLGRKSAFDIIDRIRNEGHFPKFIILSTSSDFIYTKQALQHSVFDFLLKPLDREDSSAVLQRLFERLNESREKRGGAFIENRQFRNLVNYIKSNMGKELRLSDLSEMFGLNPSYCSQLFKKYFGKSFSRFVNGLKIDKACFYLINSDLTLEDIAFKAGFNDYGYFMKTFRKIKDMTPNTYRQSSKKRTS